MACFHKGVIGNQFPHWVWVQEAPPRGREAGGTVFCLFTFLGLPKGQLGLARTQQPCR